MLNENMSGSADITFGIPPYFVNFASASPKVRETANRPGSTLCGPNKFSPFICGIDVWYISPPFFIILVYSSD